MQEHTITSILLIDDDEDDGYLFQTALKEIDKSIACIVYHDPEKAVKALKSFTLNPDCIFLDLNMPKMSGFEVLRELKAVKRLWHIPVIVCSTTQNETHIAEAKALGAAQFIHKPDSQRELMREIRAAMLGMGTAPL